MDIFSIFNIFITPEAGLIIAAVMSLMDLRDCWKEPFGFLGQILYLPLDGNAYNKIAKEYISLNKKATTLDKITTLLYEPFE